MSAGGGQQAAWEPAQGLKWGSLQLDVAQPRALASWGGRPAAARMLSACANLDRACKEALSAASTWQTSAACKVWLHRRLPLQATFSWPGQYLQRQELLWRASGARREHERGCCQRLRPAATAQVSLEAGQPAGRFLSNLRGIAVGDADPGPAEVQMARRPGPHRREGMVPDGVHPWAGAAGQTRSRRLACEAGAEWTRRWLSREDESGRLGERALGKLDRATSGSARSTALLVPLQHLGATCCSAASAPVPV